MSWFTHNLTLKLLSLALAFATWGAVAYAENPEESNVYHVPLTMIGQLPSGLVATGSAGQVAITMVGLRLSIGGFHRESLHATVDMSEAHLGTNHLAVRVATDERNVTITDWQPRFVDVTVDQVATVTRPIDVRVGGTPASGFVAGTPAVTPAQVTLTGPRTLLQSAVAYVSVDLGGRAADVQDTYSVKVEGPNHAPLSPSLVVLPSQVQVSVPLNRATVPVKIALVGNYVGQPASGYHVLGVIDVVPNVITVQGDPTVVAKLTTIDLDPVDVTGRSSDVTRSVTLRLPAGVTIVGGSNQVTETAHIAANPSPSPQPSPSPNASPSPSPTP